MSAKAVSRLAKPQMRGLLTDQIKKHLVAASVLSVSTMLAYKFLVADPRKATYAEFYRSVFKNFNLNLASCFSQIFSVHYRNYDVEKEYNRMKQAGIFQSVKPSQ